MKHIHFGLASYNKPEIQNNNDFYNVWHNKEYYQDYLKVNDNEKIMFSQIIENQKNDNHPPLYYFILRIAMGFNINVFSKWPGIVINIIIYIFITIFMYLIGSKILRGKEKYKEKSVFLAFISSIMLSSVTSAIFIRMYALSTLNIVITTYLHLKLLEKENKSNMILIGISLSVLIGSLTHYYYLFYLVALFIMFVIKYIKEKKYKQVIKYILAIGVAGICSLIIFPYSINHIFFGYRGKGVLNNLSNIGQHFVNILLYLFITNVYVFNDFLIVLMLVIVSVCIYKMIRHKKIIEEKNKYVKYIAIPTLFYFIIVSICSPYIELRYIIAVSPMIFILMMNCIYEILQNLFKEKTINKIMIFIFISMIIMPFISNDIIDLIIGKDFRNEQEGSYSSKAELIENLKNKCNIPIELIHQIEGIPLANVLLYIKDFKIEPEVLYSNKRDIMKKVTNELKSVPALYLFNSDNNRFLDDILLFANIKESYIAKDIGCTKENIKDIMENKDISNGILIFINDWQNNEKIVDIVKQSMNLSNVTYLKRLNMCDVYYIK